MTMQTANSIKSLLRKILPASFRAFYHQTRYGYALLRGRKLLKQLVIFLKTDHVLSIDEKEVLDYFLARRSPTVFPYDYCRKYSAKDIEVVFDKEKRLYCTILFDGKKLYFKRKMNRSSCARYISSIMSEQDSESPHSYLSDDFAPSNNGLLVDAGAAEGFFALSQIDTSSKVFLIEPDDEWQEALKATFEPYADKTVIVPKFVSDNSEGMNIALDDLFADGEKPTFIKADIEGFETKLLLGAEGLLRSARGLSLALCTYHRQSDYDDLSVILTRYNCALSHSKGYMFMFTDPALSSPYLRRGILRAAIK